MIDSTSANLPRPISPVRGTAESSTTTVRQRPAANADTYTSPISRDIADEPAAGRSRRARAAHAVGSAAATTTGVLARGTHLVLQGAGRVLPVVGKAAGVLAVPAAVGAYVGVLTLAGWAPVQLAVGLLAAGAAAWVLTAAIGAGLRSLANSLSAAAAARRERSAESEAMGVDMEPYVVTPPAPAGAPTAAPAASSI